MQPARNINNELTGEIIRLVCEVWGVTRADLMSRSHRRPLPWVRSQLCHYLRQYAGHDSISCAALLKIDDQSVCGYKKRYPKMLVTYVPFRDRDERIHAALKALLAAK